MRTEYSATSDVMEAACEIAMRFVASGEIVEAVLGAGEGEASCLTLTIHGNAEPFYLCPDVPDEDVLEEGPCVELYVERIEHDDFTWEPVPFLIELDTPEAMRAGLDEVFDFLLQQ